MTEDADLTEFFDGDGSTPAGADGDGSTPAGADGDATSGEGGGRAGGDVGDGPPGDVAPASATSAWAVDGACEACGAAARRRWRDGERLVCADCKAW